MMPLLNQDCVRLSHKEHIPDIATTTEGTARGANKRKSSSYAQGSGATKETPYDSAHFFLRPEQDTGQVRHTIANLAELILGGEAAFCV